MGNTLSHNYSRISLPGLPNPAPGLNTGCNVLCVITALQKPQKAGRLGKKALRNNWKSCSIGNHKESLIKRSTGAAHACAQSWVTRSVWARKNNPGKSPIFLWKSPWKSSSEAPATLMPMNGPTVVPPPSTSHKGQAAGGGSKPARALLEKRPSGLKPSQEIAAHVANCPCCTAGRAWDAPCTQETHQKHHPALLLQRSRTTWEYHPEGGGRAGS